MQPSRCNTSLLASKVAHYIFGLETSQPFTHAGNHLMPSDQELDWRFIHFHSRLEFEASGYDELWTPKRWDKLLFNLSKFKAWWALVDHEDGTSLLPGPADYWSKSDLHQTLGIQELSRIRRQWCYFDNLDRESVHQILNNFKYIIGHLQSWANGMCRLSRCCSATMYWLHYTCSSRSALTNIVLQAFLLKRIGLFKACLEVQTFAGSLHTLGHFSIRWRVQVAVRRIF